MRTMTARALKNKTGEAMRAVSRGEKVIVTLRGKPFALISPASEELPEKTSLRQYKEAWDDIELALDKTKPYLKTAKEVMSWTRKRPASS